MRLTIFVLILEEDRRLKLQLGSPSPEDIKPPEGKQDYYMWETGKKKDELYDEQG